MKGRSRDSEVKEVVLANQGVREEVTKRYIILARDLKVEHACSFI